MLSREFKECLVDVYHGEVAGEIASEILLSDAKNPDEKHILGTLLQFETEGKAIMRPLLSSCGLELQETPESRSGGTALGTEMRKLPWKERFATLHDLVASNYLPRYEELATLVSEEENAAAARIAKFMGKHERAFVEVARRISMGLPDPVSPIVDLLHFPLKSQEKVEV